MLIDSHAHSSGISKCCRITFEEVLNQAIAVGIDGVVLYNHYQKSYISDNNVFEYPLLLKPVIKDYLWEAFAVTMKLLIKFMIPPRIPASFAYRITYGTALKETALYGLAICTPKC